MNDWVEALAQKDQEILGLTEKLRTMEEWQDHEIERARQHFEDFLAEKEREITALKKFYENTRREYDKRVSELAWKDQRIAQLEAMNRSLMSAQESMAKLPDCATPIVPDESLIVMLQATIDAKSELVSQKNRDLEGASQRLAAMSAILEKVLHLREWRNPGEPINCRKDCPACQWEALKAK